MGRQINFHMLEEDRAEFFGFLSRRHQLVASAWTSQTSKVIQCEAPAQEKGTLALWEPKSGTGRERKLVQRNDGSTAYEFDRQNSILEFDPGMLVVHAGSPALLQGRLYSFLSELSTETADLFLTARRWIKQSFEPCPFKLLGGYVGPAAMSWLRRGGILLPAFNPPATPAWERFIASQHEPVGGLAGGPGLNTIE